MQWEVAESMWQFQHYRYRQVPTPSEEIFRSIKTPLGSTVFSPQAPLFYLLSLPIYWPIQSMSVLTQLYILRILSVTMQVITVWLTYLLARLVFEGETNRPLWLAAAGVVAFLPQYTFISASYNNDNLVPPLVAAALFTLIQGLKKQGSFGWFVLSIFLGGMSFLAKRTAIAILPVLLIGGGIYALLWIQSKSMLRRVIGVIVLSASILAIAAGCALLLLAPSIPEPLARNLRLGSESLQVLSSFWAEPVKLLEFDWSWVFRYISESFWGWFGWLTIKIQPYWINALQWLAALSIIGMIIGWVKILRDRQGKDQWFKGLCFIFMVSGLLLTLLVMLVQYVVDPIWHPPQGRYLFPFISSFAILIVFGWRALFPTKWRQLGLLVPLISLVVVDIASWITLLRVFYS